MKFFPLSIERELVQTVLVYGSGSQFVLKFAPLREGKIIFAPLAQFLLQKENIQNECNNLRILHPKQDFAPNFDEEREKKGFHGLKSLISPENQVKTKKRSSRSAVEAKTKLRAETEKPIAVLVTNLSLLALRLGGAGPPGPKIRCNINQTTVRQKVCPSRSPFSHPQKSLLAPPGGSSTTNWELLVCGYQGYVKTRRR